MEEGWGPVTSLRERLLEGTGAASANELLHRFYTPEYPRSRVATFAPIIDSAAQAGDIVAQGILAAAAKALAAYASGVHTNLFNGTTTQVAYVGGVFASDSLRNRFELEIENHAGCRVQAPAKSPVEGALLLATKQA
jgi:N-acetylglucosamine kinase-like BadF-type ATPase